MCVLFMFLSSINYESTSSKRIWTGLHDCIRLAVFIGTKLATGAQACFCADCKERGHEARGFGEWQVIDWAMRRPGQAEAAEGGIGGAFSYHRFRTAACLEMRKAATRSVSRPGHVMVRHLWMPGGHRRGPPLGFLSF